MKWFWLHFRGSNPPGARFDPFGPPNPARPDRGTGQFAMPDPDHERPPSSDYDDMFM
jgi:proteasome inhibitor subunit 1 (PI31)